MNAEIRRLSDCIIGEIFLALGFAKFGQAYRLFGGLFRRVADRLSTIAVTSDRMITTDGFPAAAAWMLTHWCQPVKARGSKTIPAQGPLLVISNHAGSYDTFILAFQIGRNDLNLIASDVPFLKNLPNANSHCYFISEQTQDRMTAARAGMRHLKQGGALLLYGTGLIDPDPAVYPGADHWIEKWLPSIDLFLRAAPDTRVVLSICSGVVSERWARHPITWLKRIDWQKRRVAEFSQVLEQLLRPGVFYLSPCVTFSPPMTVKELSAQSPSDRLLPEVIARGKALLSDHCIAFSCHPRDT